MKIYEDKIILFHVGEKKLQYFDVDIAHLEKKCTTQNDAFLFSVFENGEWKKHENDCTPNESTPPHRFPWGSWNPITNPSGSGKPQNGNGWKTDEK